MKEKIVKGKIPLLFSKSSFKKVKAVVDMASDKITIFDKEIKKLIHIFPPVDIIASIFIQPKQRKKIAKRY